MRVTSLPRGKRAMSGAMAFGGEAKQPSFVLCTNRTGTEILATFTEAAVVGCDRVDTVTVEVRTIPSGPSAPSAAALAAATRVPVLVERRKTGRFTVRMRAMIGRKSPGSAT